MPNKNPRNLPLLLAQARESVISNFRPILRHIGLTEQQWRILRVLVDAPLRPSQISDVCQILKPSLTGVLSRMEELGLIEKRRFDNDPRQMLVACTTKGKDLVKKTMPLVESQYQAMEEVIGPALLDQVYSILDQLMASLEQPVPLVKLPRSRKPKA
ncbi:MAG TPA: homoprotocatechuate degradation operon regulator HpaR [Rhodocyclaceae bacterium]|nr:homoprotocatechuate degradation operon regulator HpaR [Rhodocyclaceae bacterium]